MAPDSRRRSASWRAAAAAAAAVAGLVGAVIAGLPVVRAEARVKATPPVAIAQDSGTALAAVTAVAVARNPQRADNLVAAASTEGAPPGAFLSWTVDGGARWQRTALPLPRGLDRPHWPDVAFAPDGTLYVLYVTLHGSGNTPDHLWLSRSADGGQRLSPPVQVSGSLAFQDRIVVAPDGTVHVTWLQGVGVGQLSLTGPSPVMSAHSTDGGRSFSEPVQVSDPERTRVGAAVPAVAPDGSVVVLYEDFRDDVRDFQNLDGPPWTEPLALVVSRSTDGGETFGPGGEIDSAVIAPRRFIPFTPPFPALAAGAEGSMVAAWADAAGGVSRVLLSHSTDGGVTWTAPSPLGTGAGPAALPAASIAPDGRLDILYLTGPIEGSGSRVDAHLASATAAGRAFIDRRLDGESFDPNPLAAPPIPGAAPVRPPTLTRIGLTGTESEAVALWTASGPDATAGPALARVEMSTTRTVAGAVVTAALLLLALAAAGVAAGYRQPALVAAARGRAVAVVSTATGIVGRTRRRIGDARAAQRARTPPRSARFLRIGSRAYPVLLPSLRDPRLHVAGALLSVQVLGQVALGFTLSIAQILLALGTCAALEVVITFAWQRMLIWPASALLTGNGAALIVRVPGTQHGDWWSLHGAEVFVVAGAASLLSKYLIRIRGKHIFNPSNVGIVICFLALGSVRSDPQDLWWGPMSPGLAITYALIVAGGFVILRRLRMLAMAMAFTVGFALLVAVIASGGHCMTARWHLGPVCGGFYWWTIVTSPEILIFTFFMITDPQTAPRGGVERIIYGFAVAFAAALLAAPQRTEFSTKVAILSGLVLVCAVQRLVERFLPVLAARRRVAAAWVAGSPAAAASRLVSATRLLVPGAVAAGLLVACVGMVMAATAPGGALSASGAELAAAARAVASRPTLPIDPASLPAVTISPGVRPADPSINDTTARRLGHDVVEDLMIGSMARRELDRRLAATAATGPWLQGELRDITRARRAGRRDVPTYHLTAVTLVLASNPNDYQASPEVAVEVRGTVEHTAYAGASGEAVLGTSTAELHRTLAVQLVVGHYLLTADYTPR